MKNKPTVTIVHSIPGRFRVRVSRPFKKNPDYVKSTLLKHPGMKSLEYTQQTGSMLVYFDHEVVVREEIVLRIAFELGMEYGAVPVRLCAAIPHPPLSRLTRSSGVLVAASLFTHLTGTSLTIQKYSESLAGGGTALAVAQHGWQELRERGYFDPEVLTLIYLISSFVKGSNLTVSIITWLTTFGRHLIEAPTGIVEVRPIPLPSQDEETPLYGIMIAPDTDMASSTNTINRISNFLRHVVHGRRTDFMDGLRDVARLHDRMLEGFDRKKRGIPVMVK